MEKVLDLSKKKPLSVRDLNQGGFPKRFWSLTHKDFVARTYYADMHDYIMSMPEVLATGQSLFIWGGSGSGKSALASYIARVFSEYGTYARFATAQMIQDDIDQRIYDRDDDMPVERVYREMPLLVIDGIGQEATNRRGNSAIVQLFDDRFMAMLPTIFTCPLDDLKELFALKIYPDFFKQKIMKTCRIIHCGEGK